MAKGKLISCLCKTSKMDCQQTERFINLVTPDGHKCRKLERGKKMGMVLDEYDVVNVWLTMGQGIDTCEL